MSVAPIQSFPSDRQAKRRVLLDAVESVRETVEAGIEASERAGTLSPAIVEAMQEAGLYRLKLPAELGGAEADPVTQIEVIEAMSRIYPSAGWVLMTNATAIGNAGAFLSDEAIEQVFVGGQVPRAATVGGSTSTIVAVGPHPPAPSPSSRRGGAGGSFALGSRAGDAEGFILNGRWPFCSGVPHSEWICLGARLYRAPDVAPDVYTCFVPTASVTVHDNWQVAGLRGSGSNDVSATDLFVPAAFAWKQQLPLRGARQRGGPIFLLGLPGSVSSEHASFALGAGQRALELIKESAAGKRRGRGAASTVLAERPAFQRFVAESELKLRAVRMMTMEVHERAWERVCAGVTPPAELEAEMRASAVMCTDVALEVATQAFRFAGGSALYDTNRLQMCWRDVNAGAQHFAVSEVAYENMGQYVLGLPEANAYY
jgi:alkylation response protein AidB-like acyl-CoA dehydrogenase